MKKKMLANKTNFLTLLIVFTFASAVLARTTEEVTRNIAIAGLVIAGVAFLMTCCLCLGGAGMGMFHFSRNRDNEGRGTSNPPIEVRTGNAL
jgi:hypothetical protein